MTPQFHPLYLEVSFVCLSCGQDCTIWGAESEDEPPMSGQFWTCPHCRTVYRFGMVGNDLDGEFLAIRLASRTEIANLGPPAPRASALARAS